MSTISRIHFIIGLAVIIHFVITGILMRVNFFSIELQDTLVRMMLRANHIYILFSGLVHLLLSYALRDIRTNKLLIGASIILILATIGINIGFYVDPIKHVNLTTDLLQRDLTGYAVQACLLGVGLHLLWLQLRTMKK